MNEEKNKKDKEAVDVTIPPQSSVKLVSHGKLGVNNFYYTWEIKKYCDNLDVALVDIADLDKKLRDKYGNIN